MSEPKIRFRKSDGTAYTDWETVSLGDIAKRVTRKNKDNETDLPLTIASLEGLVDQRSYFGKTVASKDMSGYYLLQKGEYAYNKSYSVGYDYGSIKRLNNYDKGALSTLYISFALDEEVNSDFMQCYFNSLRWYDQMPEICAEGARNHGLLNVSTEDFFSIAITMPKDDEEKRKIASFFEMVDQHIIYCQRELDKWNELKKGMLQKMFPKEGESVPEIRFPGFSDEWQIYNMGEIYTERKEPGNNHLAILTVSIHTGVSDGEQDEESLGKAVRRIEDKTAYKHVHAGDLVFNMMRAWQGAIGSAKNEGMVSPAYITAEPDKRIYPPFLTYYFKRKEMIDQINSLSYGVTDFRKRLYWDSFIQVKCKMPSFNEQKQIAEGLKRLEEIAEVTQRELDKWKELKKGLLQQMFV